MGQQHMLTRCRRARRTAAYGLRQRGLFLYRQPPPSFAEPQRAKFEHVFSTVLLFALDAPLHHTPFCPCHRAPDINRPHSAAAPWSAATLAEILGSRCPVYKVAAAARGVAGSAPGRRRMPCFARPRACCAQ
eukprot:366083-Chlamydomonas_euryale.AAC.16